MKRGAINGVPVWIRTTETMGSERTVIKESPGVDGAVVETQGQKPHRYQVEFTLFQDGQWVTSDYITATLELRAMFLFGGPFTIEDPSIGELTDLWLGGDYSLNYFDESREELTQGSATFIEAAPFPVLQDDATANVEAAISALSAAQAIAFASAVPDTGVEDGMLLVLAAIGEWAATTQAIISAAFEPVNEFSSDIQQIRGDVSSLLRTPQNFASRVMQTAYGLLSLVPALSRQGDPRTGSAAVQDAGNDKPAVVYTQALDLGANFDADIPPPQGEVLGSNASEIDLLEIDQMNSARSLSLVAISSAVCLATTTTAFATLNSLLDVADSLEPVFERLFALPDLDYRVYQQSRALRASTRQFLAEQSADLPRLRSFTTSRETDVFDVLPDLYESLASEAQVQAAVDSLVALNSIPDPTTIHPDTTLRYLDPLT